MNEMIKCRKDKLGFINKLTLVMILMGSIMLLPIASYAQDFPGDCGNPDLDPTVTYTCPLDTWVWVLVIIAAIAGSFYINIRKKLQDQA